MNSQSSFLTAQYNNIMTTPNQLGKVRGNGEFSTAGMSSNWQTQQEPTYTSEYPNGGMVQADCSDYAKVSSFENVKWNYGTAIDKTSLKGDSSVQFGLNVLNETPTSLNVLFFNKTNVEYLSNRIVDDVYRLTGIKIKAQDQNSLIVIMTNKYEYLETGFLPTGSFSFMVQNRGPKNCSLKDRLIRLNQAVLQECVQSVLSGINMYIEYYKCASSMPVPLSLPTVMTMKGSRELCENIGLFSGNSAGANSYNMRNNIIN